MVRAHLFIQCVESSVELVSCHCRPRPGKQKLGWTSACLPTPSVTCLPASGSVERASQPATQATRPEPWLAVCSGDGARVATKQGEASPDTQAKSVEVGRAPCVLVPGCAKKRPPQFFREKCCRAAPMILSFSLSSATRLWWSRQAAATTGTLISATREASEKKAPTQNPPPPFQCNVESYF